MLTRKIIVCLLFVIAPAAVLAEVQPGELPAAAKWYFHIDFETMRKTEGGQHLYRFLQGEVFSEVREEAGVDLEKEADRITAYAAGDDTLVVVVDGNISQQTRDKVMGMGAATGAMDRFESDGKDYYYIKNDDYDAEADDESRNVGNSYSDDHHLNGLHAGAYFSFAISNKVIVTSSEADMRAMLANKGRMPSSDVGKGALLVMTADKSLLQAGLHTNEFADEAGWDSNIINNTEQLALLIADEAGKIAIKAQLVAAEKQMVESLASIVRGLIALQAFNEDMDPEITQFLQQTNVDVEGSTLTIKLTLDPEVVIAAIE